MSRSRRELSNAYFLAKFGFDAAENEPFQVCTSPIVAHLPERLERRHFGRAAAASSAAGWKPAAGTHRRDFLFYFFMIISSVFRIQEVSFVSYRFLISFLFSSCRRFRIPCDACHGLLQSCILRAHAYSSARRAQLHSMAD